MQTGKTPSNWCIYQRRLKFKTGRTECRLAHKFFTESWRREVKRKWKKIVEKNRQKRKEPKTKYMECVDRWHMLSEEDKRKLRNEQNRRNVNTFSYFMGKCLNGDV